MFGMSLRKSARETAFCSLILQQLNNNCKEALRNIVLFRQGFRNAAFPAVICLEKNAEYLDHNLEKRQGFGGRRGTSISEEGPGPIGMFQPVLVLLCVTG